MKNYTTLNLLVCLFILANFVSGQTNIQSSSFIGGDLDDDRVYGSKFLKDGTIILAANISNTNFIGITPKFLNGANENSSGAIIRLSNDGRRVLSVTKIASYITDISIDSSERLYIAAYGNSQALILDKNASKILWSKKFDKRVHRIDVGNNGRFVVLTSNAPHDDKKVSGASIYSFDNQWGQVGKWGSVSQYTNDVCIDETSKTIIGIGFKNIRAADQSGSNPVDVSVYRGWSYNGNLKYTGYDWNGKRGNANWINRPRNNMADTRGARCEMGKDGKLYMSFAADGGNHIFRHDPFDINKTVNIVGGDRYHVFSNTGTEKKTFFGRYEASTGKYLKGQQFCARSSSGRGNTAHPEFGDIAADSEGRVFLTGTSASGLPLTLDPLPGGYSGGPFVLVMSPDFKTRELVTRSAEHFSSRGHSIDFLGNKILMGGYINSKKGRKLATVSAIDNSANGNDGFFTLFSTSSDIDPNISPSASITSPTSGSTFNLSEDIIIRCNASDSDGTIDKVVFYVNGNKIGEDTTFPFNITWRSNTSGQYVLSAKAIDNDGAFTTSAEVVISVTNDTAVQSPYLGTPISVPGVVEMENYDLGGKGVSYNDTDAANLGGNYRNDGVDIDVAENGGYGIGWIRKGEWLEYTVDVKRSGLYKIEARVASATNSGSFYLDFGGSRTSTISVPNTGGWSSWRTISLSNFTLSSKLLEWKYYLVK
ncbi:Ig-like domain-containing protein [Aquimarina litoralis]|uniref:Ig-like domain-containing protein n=1 Tax=Aquimarina litoralis TaxID=584605 RepID=UPI0031D2CD9A